MKLVWYLLRPLRPLASTFRVTGSQCKFGCAAPEVMPKYGGHSLVGFCGNSTLRKKCFVSDCSRSLKVTKATDKSMLYKPCFHLRCNILIIESSMLYFCFRFSCVSLLSYYKIPVSITRFKITMESYLSFSIYIFKKLFIWFWQATAKDIPTRKFHKSRSSLLEVFVILVVT